MSLLRDQLLRSCAHSLCIRAEECAPLLAELAVRLVDADIAASNFECGCGATEIDQINLLCTEIERRDAEMEEIFKVLFPLCTRAGLSMPPSQEFQEAFRSAEAAASPLLRLQDE